jgi:FMN phosphatase YigB (HAD superfamily)
MGSSAKLLREYISEIATEAQVPKRRLRIFDFDDTLVKTDAMVHVTDAQGLKFDLMPSEFATYERQPGDKMDYTDFHLLINPRAIRWTNRILERVYDTHGEAGVVVLSARSSHVPIEQFLNELGLTGIEIIALDNADPAVKASWVSARIERDSLEFVEFFDDSHKNVAAIRELQNGHPTVQIVARCIVYNRISSLHA